MARWLSIALVLSTGCSLALSGPDPARPKRKAPECDTGKGLVMLDGLVATGAALTTISLAGSSNNSTQEVALLPAVIGAAFLGSALRGNSVVNACRQEMEDYVAGAAPRDEPPLRDTPRLHEVRAADEQESRPHPKLVAAKPAVAPKPPPPPPPPPPPATAPEARGQKPEAPPPAWVEFWKEVP